MGLHDYVSFVARNGQNLPVFSFLTPSSRRKEEREIDNILENWEEYYGCDNDNDDDLPCGAMIVTLPGDIRKRDIFRMKLTDCAQYSNYSWDHWDFIDSKTKTSPNSQFPDYRDILLGKEYQNEISYAVWKKPPVERKSPTRQKEEGRDWFVNFEYREYHAFVLAQVNPEDIEAMFPTFNKKEMFDLIVSNQK